MESFVVWFLLVLSVILFVMLPIYYYFRKRYAKRKVAGRSTEEKTEELNKDLESFGFAYDSEQDAVYSLMYPWQREMGYCELYDKTALAFRMAIHSEPIYFRYNQRRWLIEFWKGQYGMTTGGEIGIYVTDKEDISVPGVFEGPFFDCVTDEERIGMEYVLYRNQIPVIERKQLHWWLTGFDVGVFSKPEHLSMEIALTFPNRAMQEAFLRGLKEAGYQEETYRVIRNRVQINFTEPKAKQHHGKKRILYHHVQRMNRLYCGVFRYATRDYAATLDKIDYIRFMYPVLYRKLIGIGNTGKMINAMKITVKKLKKAGEVEG